jgi:hypothetical protein
MGTSRARTSEASLYIVKPIPDPDRHEPQEPPAQKPSPTQEPSTQEPSPPPAEESSTPAMDSDDRADLDARLIGMSVMLRMALRLMKSYGDASPSPSQRERSR